MDSLCPTHHISQISSLYFKGLPKYCIGNVNIELKKKTLQLIAYFALIIVPISKLALFLSFLKIWPFDLEITSLKYQLFASKLTQFKKNILITRSCICNSTHFKPPKGRNPFAGHMPPPTGIHTRGMLHGIIFRLL